MARKKGGIMAFEQGLLNKCVYSSLICQLEMLSILWGHCGSKLELSGWHPPCLVPSLLPVSPQATCSPILLPFLGCCSILSFSLKPSFSSTFSYFLLILQNLVHTSHPKEASDQDLVKTPFLCSPKS